MTTGDWIYAGAGGAVAAGGFLLLVWAVFADRLRVREHRRLGALRRCPRCWYDMCGVLGLRCPECGRETGHERSLTRARQRWGWAAVAILALASGGATIAYPHSRNGAWKQWLPDTAVILLIPYPTEDGWAATEMAGRLDPGRSAPRIDAPGRLASWQWSLLTGACVGALNRASSSAHDNIYWRMLVLESPTPEAGYSTMIRHLHDSDEDRAWQAAIHLEESKFRLSASQLAEASAAMLALPLEPGCRRDIIRSWAESMAIQLRSRSEPALQKQLRRIDSMELSPETVIDALDHHGANEWYALCHRLALPRRDWLGFNSATPDSLRVSRVDMLIDDDNAGDCALIVTPADGDDWCEVIVLVRRREEWRFAGRLDLPSHDGPPPSLRSQACDTGRRWLIVRHDQYRSQDRSKYSTEDFWCRVRGDRLVLEQRLSPEQRWAQLITRAIESGEPRLIQRGSAYFATYDTVSTAELALRDRTSGRALVPVTSVCAALEYPLKSDPQSFGAFVSAPADLDPRWFGRVSESRFLPVIEARLTDLASSADPGVRSTLSAIVDRYGTLPEVEGLARALADR